MATRTSHLPRATSPPPMSRPSSGKTYGSLSLIGSSRQADNDRDDASLAGQPGTEGTRSPVSQAPSVTSAPRPAGARPLRKMSSCPSDLRSPSTSGALDPAPGAMAADDAAVNDPSTPLPDIDASMLSMRTLSTGVSDAQGFQRHKLRRAFMDHDAPHKRQKADNATIGCRRCGTEDTPRWRNGPEGPGTLCNVCGLLSASRERRKHPAAEPKRG